MLTGAYSQLLALKAQGFNPSTALQEAKQIFDMELEGVKKRLEDDMNQTKQLLAYGSRSLPPSSS